MLARNKTKFGFMWYRHIDQSGRILKYLNMSRSGQLGLQYSDILGFYTGLSMLTPECYFFFNSGSEHFYTRHCCKLEDSRFLACHMLLGK